MVADGKLKKKDVACDSVIYRGEDNSYYEKVGDHEPICIENDLPFDLPQGWTWTRIGTAFVINPRNDALDNTAASFVPMAAIDPDFTSTIHPERRPWKTIKRGFTHFADGDIVFSKISPCFENGKCFIASGLANGIGSGTTELFVLRPVDNSLERKYVFDYLSSRTFIHGATKTFMGTVGQQRVKREYVEQSLLPVPPKNEQIKICTTLSAFAQILCFE